jgi:hypothetical protein
MWRRILGFFGREYRRLLDLDDDERELSRTKDSSMAAQTYGRLYYEIQEILGAVSVIRGDTRAEQHQANEYTRIGELGIYRTKDIIALENALGIRIGPNDYLWEIASRMREHE